MQARAQILVLVLFAVLAVVPFAFAEDEAPKPQKGVGSGAESGRPAPPPPVAVPASRTSKTWVEKPGGTRVAVGPGREFRGVRVHLSLMWDLIGIDTKTDKTLYAVNVGAFWNQYGFKEIRVDGKPVWAVELAPGPRARAGQTKRQYHDLRTGKQLVPDGTKKPDLGKPLKLRKTWSGAQSLVDQPLHRMVSTQENWDTLRTHLFGEKPPVAFGAIDFTKEVVLVVSSGNGWNCDGITLHSAHQNDDRVLVRTDRKTYQTMNGGRKARPWGVFVLPRVEATHYIVERNAQSLIRGPALWRESYRTIISDPAMELRLLPARAKKAHRGWSR